MLQRGAQQVDEVDFVFDGIHISEYMGVVINLWSQPLKNILC
jgi:hypothetical protein